MAYVGVIVVPGAIVGRSLSSQVNADLGVPAAPSAGAVPVAGAGPSRSAAPESSSPTSASGIPTRTPPTIPPSTIPTEDTLVGWAAGLSPAVGIPTVALAAYGRAQLSLEGSSPGCRMSWPTLAGIGWVESDHGRYAGAVLGPDGRSTPPIVGVVLAGQPGLARIPDTDGGALDADATYDRAVGPLQFIPSTWALWASDGDGDGVADVFDLDDAALAAARYLCAAGGDMTVAEGWTAAVLAYNYSGTYVDTVRAAANEYAIRSQSR